MWTSDWVVSLLSVCVCHLQTWYEQVVTTEQVEPATTFTPAGNITDLQNRLLTLCKKDKTKGKQQEAPVFGVPHDMELNLISFSI